MVLESRSCGTKTQPKFVLNLVVMTVGHKLSERFEIRFLCIAKKSRKLITVKTYQYVLLAVGGNVKLQYEPCSTSVDRAFLFGADFRFKQLFIKKLPDIIKICNQAKNREYKRLIGIYRASVYERTMKSCA